MALVTATNEKLLTSVSIDLERDHEFRYVIVRDGENVERIRLTRGFRLIDLGKNFDKQTRKCGKRKCMLINGRYAISLLLSKSELATIINALDLKHGHTNTSLYHIAFYGPDGEQLWY